MKIIQTQFRDINPLGIFILLDQQSYDAYSKFILNLNKIKDFHKGPFKLYVAKIEKESTFKAFEGYNIIGRLITDRNEVPKYAVDNIPVKNDIDFLEALSDFIYELYDADLKNLIELYNKDDLFDEEKEIFGQILHLFKHKKNSLPERDDENPLYSNIFACVDFSQPLRAVAHSATVRSVKEKADMPQELKDRIREDKELQLHIETLYDSLMYIKKSGININKLFEDINLDNDEYDDLTIELKKIRPHGRSQYKIQFSFGKEKHLSNLKEGDQTFVYAICLLFSKQGLPFFHHDLVWNKQDYDNSINTNPKLKWLERLHSLMFKDSDGNRKEFKERILSLGRDRGGGSRSYSHIKSRCNSQINKLLQEHSISLPQNATITTDRRKNIYYIPIPAERIIIPEEFERLASGIPKEMKFPSE